MGHAFTDGHHFAGNFQAGDIRGAGRWRIVPLALQHVGTVNASGGDFHQQFARLWLGYRAFGDNQNLGAPGWLISIAFIVPGCAAFVDMVTLLIVADVVIRLNARNKVCC